MVIDNYKPILAYIINTNICCTYESRCICIASHRWL